MNKSENISTIAAAIAKAQKNIGAATKDARNPFFKSSYADLGSVMDVCKEPLLEQGVSVLQMVGSENGDNYLETILLHESGEYISDRMKLICAKQHDPQAMGSAITYARRYALQSALFIPAVDDDGEKAMQSTRAADSANGAIEQRQEKREQAASAFTQVRDTMKQRPEDVVCRRGKETKGKQVGELTDAQRAFFASDEFTPSTNADHELKAACRAISAVPARSLTI